MKILTCSNYSRGKIRASHRHEKKMCIYFERKTEHKLEISNNIQGHILY